MTGPEQKMKNKDAQQVNDIIFVVLLSKSGRLKCYRWFIRGKDKYEDLRVWIETTLNIHSEIRLERDGKTVVLKNGATQDSQKKLLNTVISNENADRVELRLLS